MFKKFGSLFLLFSAALFAEGEPVSLRFSPREGDFRHYIIKARVLLDEVSIPASLMDDEAEAIIRELNSAECSLEYTQTYLIDRIESDGSAFMQAVMKDFTAKVLQGGEDFSYLTEGLLEDEVKVEMKLNPEGKFVHCHVFGENFGLAEGDFFGFTHLDIAVGEKQKRSYLDQSFLPMTIEQEFCLEKIEMGRANLAFVQSLVIDKRFEFEDQAIVLVDFKANGEGKQTLDLESGWPIKSTFDFSVAAKLGPLDEDTDDLISIKIRIFVTMEPSETF